MARRARLAALGLAGALGLALLCPAGTPEAAGHPASGQGSPPTVRLVAAEGPALSGGQDPDRSPVDSVPAVLHIHFFDVGQGDAVLIRVPTGQNVLIDAGPGAGTAEYLLELGVEEIDLIIASHNHADHIGGVPAVLEAFPVRFWMDNGVPHTTATYRRALEAVKAAGVLLLEPERRTIQMGDAALEILPPPGDPALAQNDNSVGVIFRFGAFRAMFAGDAERTLWRHWLEVFPEVFEPVGVHKASHHGSRNGDIPEALERLRPELVVVSAGRANRYGHPHPEMRALYAAVGARVMITGEAGTIVVTARSDGTFTAARPPWILTTPADYHSMLAEAAPEPGGAKTPEVSTPMENSER